MVDFLVDTWNEEGLYDQLIGIVQWSEEFCTVLFVQIDDEAAIDCKNFYP